MSLQQRAIQGWTRLGTRFLPFADAASTDLPLARLLRLSLFQVSVGMALALLNGTLNRVMIVELAVPAWLVSLMVALPIVFAPLRALIGHKSDNHLSALGWKRVPYIWFGSLMMFGGLAIIPFAVLVLTGQGEGPAWVGHAGAALGFLLLGAGVHTTQTAGLALATDLAPADTRPRVVALLYVSLLLGMVVSSLAFSWLLADFSGTRLVQVVQGAAVLAIAAERRGLVETRAAAAACCAPGRRTGGQFPASLGGVHPPATCAPPDVGRGSGHRSLQHAGHPAGALWRPDPGSDAWATPRR